MSDSRGMSRAASIDATNCSETISLVRGRRSLVGLSLIFLLRASMLLCLVNTSPNGSTSLPNHYFTVDPSELKAISRPGTYHVHIHIVRNFGPDLDSLVLEVRPDTGTTGFSPIRQVMRDTKIKEKYSLPLSIVVPDNDTVGFHYVVKSSHLKQFSEMYFASDDQLTITHSADPRQFRKQSVAPEKKPQSWEDYAKMVRNAPPHRFRKGLITIHLTPDSIIPFSSGRGGKLTFVTARPMHMDTGGIELLERSAESFANRFLKDSGRLNGVRHFDYFIEGFDTITGGGNKTVHLLIKPRTPHASELYLEMRPIISRGCVDAVNLRLTGDDPLYMLMPIYLFVEQSDVVGFELTLTAGGVTQTFQHFITAIGGVIKHHWSDPTPVVGINEGERMIAVRFKDGSTQPVTPPPGSATTLDSLIRNTNDSMTTSIHIGLIQTAADSMAMREAEIEAQRRKMHEMSAGPVPDCDWVQFHQVGDTMYWRSLADTSWRPYVRKQYWNEAEDSLLRVQESLRVHHVTVYAPDSLAYQIVARQLTQLEPLDSVGYYHGYGTLTQVGVLDSLEICVGKYPKYPPKEHSSKKKELSLSNESGTVGERTATGSTILFRENFEGFSPSQRGRLQITSTGVERKHGTM